MRELKWLTPLKVLGMLFCLDCTHPGKTHGQASSPVAESANGQMLLNRAVSAFQKGDSTNAIKLATEAIAADPRNTSGFALRGSIHEQLREHVRAIADYDEVLKRDPKAASIYQRRGAEHFRLGQFNQAVADFDRVIELNPVSAPQHWQRGIALYYAGQFDKGRRQFELHQTVNPNDVENAAWHFLCVARLSGVEKARASLIPIEGDARVPMKQIHELFAGKSTPESVLGAARAGSPSSATLNNQLFYAHLYLGLYFEATGDAKKTREHILKSARDFKSDHYMGDVARAHARLLEKNEK